MEGGVLPRDGLPSLQRIRTHQHLWDEALEGEKKSEKKNKNLCLYKSPCSTEGQICYSDWAFNTQICMKTLQSSIPALSIRLPVISRNAGAGSHWGILSECVCVYVWADCACQDEESGNLPSVTDRNRAVMKGGKQVGKKSLICYAGGASGRRGECVRGNHIKSPVR